MSEPIKYKLMPFPPTEEMISSWLILHVQWTQADYFHAREQVKENYQAMWEAAQTSTGETPTNDLTARAEALLDFLESDFGQSGRDVRIEAIRCELERNAALANDPDMVPRSRYNAVCEEVEQEQARILNIQKAATHEIERLNTALAKLKDQS